MPLKSTISFFGDVARKLSSVKIPILNHLTPNSLEIVVRSCKYMVWGGAPADNYIMVYFWFITEIFGALKSLSYGVARNLRFGENPRPSSQTMVSFGL